MELDKNRDYTKEAEEKQLEAYKKNSAYCYISEFLDGIASSVDTPSIPTGFPALDGILDGGLFEGLYIIGAISSLGKTTVCLQMADQIAQSGRDVLIISLEMARTELMSKSISRLTFQRELALATGAVRSAKTAREITTGSKYKDYSQIERDLIKTAVDDYRKYAKNIYITEGIGNVGTKEIRETVKTHKELTGKAPVVIIDYLQIIAPADMRATDKQNTDKAVMELKRISRDYKTPVIAISSFNRDNYKNPAKMESFKESGACEYSSDVLIGLQLKGTGTTGFDVDKEKEKNPRQIELVILKNRNGATGGEIEYKYYPKFNCFMELGLVKKRDKAI